MTPHGHELIAGPSIGALASSLSTSSQPFGVYMRRRNYGAVRAAFWMLHIVCGTYFVAAGLLYYALSKSKLAGMLQLYAITVPRKYYATIGVVHFVVAALFGRYLIESLWRTTWTAAHKARRKISPQLTNLVPHQSGRKVGSILSSPLLTFQRSRLWRVIDCCYGALLAPSGLFGVESSHFETLFLCREVMETVLQTNQAYQMSRLLPRAGLNRLYVTVLVINCWTTPILHRFCRRDKALQRLLCLLCDTLLDFVSAVGVPVWLALDYLPDYDMAATDFPLSLWYNDAWDVRFINDAPLMLLGNWLGAFSRLMFSIGLLSTLEDMQRLIKVKLEPQSRRDIRPKTNPVNHAVAVSKRHEWYVRVVYGLMAFFGAGILVVHLFAESRPIPLACKLVVRPWLVSRPACALVEINCHSSPAFTGDRTDFESIVGPLDDLSLEYIAVRHCPQVEFTAQLQDLTSLFGLKVYNSTIASWDDEAAITKSHHPHMRFVYAVHTFFPNATIPAGLLSRDFPPALRDVEISGSNLNWLPDDLHERWPQKLTLFLEYGEFTAFPAVMRKLNPRMLSLCGNKITSVPPDAFLLPDAYTVALTGNPIRELPSSSVDAAEVYTMWIYLDFTNITSVPAWVDEAFLQHTVLFLGGSPFCRDVLKNDNSTERAELLESRPYVEQLVDCLEMKEDLQPFYPQYLETRDDERE